MGENTKPKPAYEAFVVDETGNSPYWTKVGAAWQHEDGEGLNVSLAAGIAVSGKLVLRAPDTRRQNKPSTKK
ncbi:hypothetical protein [Bradyrhizobium glycinis]|uniref:hypothetical protein n=1 Tax=Bradyrhizobium glycinis TaxID=2751812 RepID=UPI0018D68C83|nr:hypothetical protein [Bradyrhizobium glycinis]MBH5372257.1 hypothetical protein [Bradyrhizobium glycinis]